MHLPLGAGRDSALDEGERSATAALAGRGRWLLLYGDVGAGRSALLTEILRRETATDRRGTAPATATRTAPTQNRNRNESRDRNRNHGPAYGGPHGRTPAGATQGEAPGGAAAGPPGRMQILSTRAVPQEAGFAFSLLRGLFPEGVLLPFGETGPTVEQRLFHRLTGHVAALAARRPLLLAVDDADLADPPSRRWLGHLSHRLADLPVLLLLTACADPRPSGADTPGADLGARLCGDTGTALPLSPLGPGAAAHLFRLCSGTSPTSPTSPNGTGGTDRTGGKDGMDGKKGMDGADRDLLAAGAGNPLLLDALARRPRPSGSWPGGPLGTPYRTALARWLRSPAAPERRPLALALALLPPGTIDPPAAGDQEPALTTDFTAALTGLPPDRLPAARRHLAELTPMLALPSVREAVLATADHHELPFLRHRVAHALYRHGGPASDIAPLLLDTPQTGAPWIVHTLEEAAEHALRTGAPDHAARILRHALGGPVAPARHCSLTLRLSALDMLHSSRSGIRRLHESLQRADCHDPCAVSEALSGALAAQGHVDTAIRVLEDTGRTIDDEQLTAVVRVGVAALASQDARTWHHAADEMRTLAPHAPESVEPLVCALLTIHEGGTGRIDAHTAVQRVTARLHAPVHPRLRTAFTAGAAAVLEWADHLDEARGLLARELPALPALPVALDLTSQAHLHLFTVHATVERKLGRFRHLVDRLTPLLDGVRDPAVRLPYLRALTAHAWHELGRTDLAHRHLDALGAFDEPGVSWEWEEVLHTRARIHLDSGEWQQALTAYRRCGERHAVRGFVNPVGQPWRSGAAIALAHLSRHTEARALADEGLRYAHAWGTPRHIGTALRARALTLGGRERLETLEEAARVLGTAPAPTELIETLTDLGRAQIVSGRRRKGRETLRDAQGLARTLLPAAPGPATDVLSTGAGPLTPRLVALVDAALRASESGRPCRRTDPSPALLPVDELTSAERRIVELAVQGLTNDQICASLHLARRTVESHLTKAYRKLGVTRRTQLATRLAVGAATTGR